MTVGDMFTSLRRKECLANNLRHFRGTLTAFKDSEITSVDARFLAEGIRIKVVQKCGGKTRSKSRLISWSLVENHSDNEENNLSLVVCALYEDALADLREAISE